MYIYVSPIILKFEVKYVGKTARMDHNLEKLALISSMVNAEMPSCIIDYLFIGGAVSARSVDILEHIGITNIVCLCFDEIGQSDSQYPNLFQYKNFSVSMHIFVPMNELISI